MEHLLVIMWFAWWPSQDSNTRDDLEPQIYATQEACKTYTDQFKGIEHGPYCSEAYMSMKEFKLIEDDIHNN